MHCFTINTESSYVLGFEIIFIHQLGEARHPVLVEGKEEKGNIFSLYSYYLSISGEFCRLTASEFTQYILQ